MVATDITNEQQEKKKHAWAQVDDAVGPVRKAITNRIAVPGYRETKDMARRLASIATEQSDTKKWKIVSKQQILSKKNQHSIIH